MDIRLFENSPFHFENEQANEADMIESIRQRVAELIDTNAELLFSYLYRLDVEEHKIKNALQHPEWPTDQALAVLIWERQKERLETRKKYSNRKSTDK